MYYVLLTLLIIVSLLLILLILIQKGRGGGLSSAFGGGGGSAAFGAKTGDVLTWLTSSFFAVFIILAIVLDLLVNSQYKLTTPLPPKAAALPVSASTPDTSAAAVNPIPPDSVPTPAPIPPIDGVTTPMQNPAAQLGAVLDQKLKQATSAASAAVAPTTQKINDTVQPLIAPAAPVKAATQPK